MSYKPLQKHLGVTLDVKLTFKEHLNNSPKINKTVGLLRKLQNLLSSSTLRSQGTLSNKLKIC